MTLPLPVSLMLMALVLVGMFILWTKAVRFQVRRHHQARTKRQQRHSLLRDHTPPAGVAARH